MDSPTPVALLTGSLRSASPVLFSVSGLSALVPVVQVCLRAARVFCLVGGSLSAGFVWGSGFSSPSFHSPRPRSHSLSLGLSCSSLSPLGFYWLGLVSVLATFVAWIVPRHLMVAYLLVSLRFFPFLFRSLFPTFLVGSGSFASLDVLPVRSSGLSGSFVALLGSLPLHSARFWFIVFSVPCGWVGAVLPSLRPCTRSLSLWPVGCSPISSVTVPSCVLSWSLGFSIPWQFPRPRLLFPGSRILQLPPPWYSWWHLDPAFCSSWVLHPTLSHVWSLVSVSCDGFSDCSVGSKVFFLTFLTLFSVALSPV